jgi:hypothetical protein
MEQAAHVNTRRFNVSWFTNEPSQQEHPNSPHASYNFWKKKEMSLSRVTDTTERAGRTTRPQACKREVFGSNLRLGTGYPGGFS